MNCNHAPWSPLLLINNGDYGAKCSSYRDVTALARIYVSRARVAKTRHQSCPTFGKAKFKCPRNIEESKELQSLYRPQIHCVGIIAAGVNEGYYLLRDDLKQDSNCQATLLAHHLDVTMQDLRSRSGEEHESSGGPVGAPVGAPAGAPVGDSSAKST